MITHVTDASEIKQLERQEVGTIGTQLRIATWPDAEGIPHPASWQVPLGVAVKGPLLVADYGSYVPGDSSLRKDIALDESSEVYLELIALDLRDPSAIRGFADRYGLMGPFEAVVYDPQVTEPLDHFRERAAGIADAVQAWRVVQGPLALEEAMWRNPRTAPRSIEGCATLLAQKLNKGLTSFHPVVSFGDEAGPGWITEGAPIGLHPIGLEALCYLELFNHIAEGAQYRQCANPSCQVMFVRQRGRARKGQHRTAGVLYHDEKCARASSQRTYRQRKRSRKESSQETSA